MAQNSRRVNTYLKSFAKCKGDYASSVTIRDITIAVVTKSVNGNVFLEAAISNQKEFYDVRYFENSAAGFETACRWLDMRWEQYKSQARTNELLSILFSK